ncbi:MAG: diaminopimelate decarboxylase [Lachnospiraceae bacterium]|nr:diaminopimelate decarboxylase [Lachnospiraceae bacterium]
MNRTDTEVLLKNGAIKTPCYILNKDDLNAHVDRVCSIVSDIAGDRVGLCYAMKANALITDIMSEKTGHIEVCSPGELKICKGLAIPGEKIIFSGVNKTEENIHDAIEYGVDIVTLESIRQYNIVKDYVAGAGRSVKVLPRLSGGAQFGMSEEEVRFVIDDSIHTDGIDAIGIHYFTGTQKKKIDKDIEELEYLTEFIKGLKEEYGFSPKLLEYGAGLAVPYFEGDDHEHVYDSLTELVTYIAGLDIDYKVGIELGRYFAYSCMTYLTTIDDMKRCADTNILIVDGGIHHVNYYGQNMAMRVPLMDLIHTESDDKGSEMSIGAVDYSDENWKVCGSLCTFADILVRKVTLDEPKIGDALVFHNAGAYSMTESPALFLSRPMPGIYSYGKNDGLKVIRETTETYGINNPLSDDRNI